MLNPKTRFAATAAAWLLSCGGVLARTPPAPAMTVQDALPTRTQIKHLVVIFGENQSFDHYFGTYPHAANPAGEPVSPPHPARRRSTAICALPAC